MSVQVGQQAPDFELKDQTNQPVRLSDYRGKKHVVVVFYPLSFTGVCESEMCGIRDSITTFRNDEVETLAISVDSTATHARWAHEQGFDFPLLSDFWPHGEVARTYGVLDERSGLATRGTFLVDKDGTVAYADHHPIPQARDQDAWKAALRDLGALDAQA
ncbi:peroxiredoxin [Egicoccus halophilus]|uniref:Alkyl hydroperoxide reductase E n=1 Tax=Egicoccus halophilus TaxID=1670830 RepID=A0A8J3EYQ8_9ACTN|nr:peroxiredoxin [Egicoccus halophilus]GGI08384.1 putative peroxiredoxin (thioredoxin reductase) AhpE [Egicoccus halophilus]